jgi:hypothetical protein
VHRIWAILAAFPHHAFFYHRFFRHRFAFVGGPSSTLATTIAGAGPQSINLCTDYGYGCQWPAPTHRQALDRSIVIVAANAIG